MLRSFLENKVWSKTPLASANREPADGLALVRDESVWVGHVLQGAGANKLTMGAQQVGPAPGHLEVQPPFGVPRLCVPSAGGLSQ